MLSATLQALSLLLAVVSPLAASVALLPRVDNITVTSVYWQGTGCPAGSVSSSISYDRSTVTFAFDMLETYSGPGISPAEKSKNCIIYLGLRYPRGSKFEIVGATYRGHARIDTGMNGTIQSTYLITSPGATNASAVTRARIDGELIDYYTTADTISSGSRIASPCGQEEARVQIATRVSLTSAQRSDWGTIDDSPPFSLLYQQVHLGWSICEG
jgi:hypothetical protein